MTKAVYEMLLGYMQSCVADRAHDENHVLRVLSNALQIAREEPQADLDILMAACLLHDVARREEMETPGVRHAEAGAGKARAFLQCQGFSAEFCSRVADCIAAHSFGSGPAPVRIEEKILFDADKLRAGIIKACEKRPVSRQKIDEVVDEIERRAYRETEQEITSKAIGEMVMESLRKLDEVAYVRFACVYHQFRDLQTFVDELGRLISENQGNADDEVR